LYFTSEIQTGLFRPGDNTLGVTVQGVQRVSISNTQTSLTTPLAGTTATFTSTGTSNILNQSGITISNTSSAVKLEVVNGQLSTGQNSQLVTGVFRSSNPDTSLLEISEVRGIAGSSWESSGIRLQQRIDSSYMAYIQFNTGTAIENSKGISFGTGIGGTINAPVERLRITDGGNVGIGTSSPTSKLEVVGDVKANNIRIKLTGNITIYVATNGNNSNTGLTVGSPFATVQKAWDKLFTEYDLTGYQATIQLADGNYDQTLLASGLMVGQLDDAVVITGGTGVNWGYTTQNGSTIVCDGAFIALTGGMKILRGVWLGATPTDQSGWCIVSQVYGIVIIENINFGYAIHGHMAANAFGIIQINGSYTISDGAGSGNNSAVVGRHMLAVSKGIIQTSLTTGKTVTIAPNVRFRWGGDTYPGYFVESNYLGIVNLASAVYLTWQNPDNVTLATKYVVSYNALLATGGQTVPGIGAGVVTTGGQVS
jgi:hypothetical protein